MSRPLRLEFPGAIWHVTSRGNDRSAIFRDEADRSNFLEVLARVVAVTRWRLHAYVLMGNHYHLLVETPEPNLSQGMRQLNGVYTQRVNRRHGRTGHLLQGRFKGILVEKQSHLLELCRYLVLNPVRAGLARSAAEWPWSSYRATAGLGPAPEWLETRWTREQFADDQRRALLLYRAFVAEGTGRQDSPWSAVQDQLFLGGSVFQERCRDEGLGRRAEAEFPRSQQRLLRPTLGVIVAEVCREFGVSEAELLNRRSSESRKALAWIARNESALSLGEVAPALGVTTWAVSRLEKGGERLRAGEPRFRRRLEAVVGRLKVISPKPENQT